MIARLSVIALLLTVAADAAPRRRAVGVPPSPDAIRPHIVTIANRVLTTYEHADFSVAWRLMEETPDAAVNPLFVVMPVTRGHCWIAKYESERRDPAFLARALDEFEFAAIRHPQWGHGWVTASVVNLLDLGVYRVRSQPDLAPELRNRVELLWTRVLDITRAEADTRLVWNMPQPPFDSSTRGDTQAEEFAWEASLLTAAAVFLSDHPNARLWERKGRQLAYDAITRPSDPPDLEGIKTTTVTEDFGVNNHGIEHNPYYAIATLQLLQQAELPYRMTGRMTPDELHHNFRELYRVYLTYITRDASGRYRWNRHSDPGDPSLLPLGKAGDVALDLALARQMAESGGLWAESVTSGVIPESALHAVTQNHKVAWYQLVGLYYWHWPQP